MKKKGLLKLGTLIILHFLALPSIVLIYSHILLIESKRNKERLRSFYKEEKVFSKAFFFLIVSIIPFLPFIVLGKLFLRMNALSKLENADKKSFEIPLNSSENNWNDLYKCNCCNLFSRRYQAVAGSSLDFLNHCQFCGKDDSLELIVDEKYEVLEDIQFAEKIPSKKIASHMKSISDKWLMLEKSKEEFEKNKFITEMKIHQIKAYEKLKSEDLSEKVSLYEKKLAENLKEMEEFKDKILKEM